jgi:D-amino peptidase
MLSGDSALEREVRSFLPEVQVAVVKTGLEYETARLLHPTIARARIHEAARLGLADCLKSVPFRIPAPCVVEAEFQKVATATLACSIPTIIRVDDVTVRFETQDVITAQKLLRVLLKLSD